MKKYLILLAAALAILGLDGCGARETPVSPEAEVSLPATAMPTALHTPTPAPTRTPGSPRPGETGKPPAESAGLPESAAPTETPEAAPTAAPAADEPSDEEVLRVYREATEAYSWFAGYDDTGLALSLEETQIRADRTYYKVTAAGRSSLDDLRAYLKAMFSDEVVDGLLAPGQDRFLDTEDGLYALSAGRAADPAKGGITTAVLWPEEESPRSCTVQTTVELLDPNNGYAVTGQQVYSFPYAQVGDKWVFTQFESIF